MLVVILPRHLPKEYYLFRNCLFNNILVKRKAGGNKLETLEGLPFSMVLIRSIWLIAAEPGVGRHPTQMTLFLLCLLKRDCRMTLVVSWCLPFYKTRPPTGTDEDGRPIQYQQYMPVPYNLQVETGYSLQDTGRRSPDSGTDSS